MLATPSATSLVGVGLALGVNASRLGKDGDIDLASRLMLAVVPNHIGILPFSSRDRRSCAGTSPETSRGAFCFALHICLGSKVLGSQRTCLASREAFLASVEAERGWEEACSVARSAKIGFYSVATRALAIETFLYFRAWSTGLPPESSSSNFSLSK